jgi:hypothetical protein
MKVELLKTLKGNEGKVWPAGEVLEGDLPEEIISEIALDRGVVRVIEDVPKPPPPIKEEPEPEKEPEKEKGLDLDKTLEEMDAVETLRYTAEHKGGGWYDVVDNETGKKVNMKHLRKADANELIEKLYEQTEALSVDEALESMGDEEKPTLAKRKKK